MFGAIDLSVVLAGRYLLTNVVNLRLDIQLFIVGIGCRFLVVTFGIGILWAVGDVGVKFEFICRIDTDDSKCKPAWRFLIIQQLLLDALELDRIISVILSDLVELGILDNQVQIDVAQLGYLNRFFDEGL